MLEFPNYSAMTLTLSVSLVFYLGLLKKKPLLIGFESTPHLVRVLVFSGGFFLGLLSRGEKETFYESRIICFHPLLFIRNLSQS